MRNLIAILALLAAVVNAHAAATLLPNGQQCFQTATGPVSSGSLNMYVPNTTTPKTTWKDAGQVTANAQPIQLDANGCAVIYGTGSYRQQLYTGPVVGGAVSGNLVFDLTTTDTSANNNYFWAGNAGGTPNVITLTDPGFNSTDGSVIAFTAIATNTGSTTINPSSFGAIAVKKDTTGGPVSLVGGEILQNNPVEVVYRSVDNAFHILNPPIQSAAASTAPLCGASGLQINNDATTPTTKANITANSAVMVNASGASINRSSVSTSINFVTNGAGGLDAGSLASGTTYYLYLIDNGAAPTGLASLSSSAPTLPSGYTFSCRIAAWNTSPSAATLLSFATRGNRTSILNSPGGSGIYVSLAAAGTCFTTFASTILTGLPLTATVAIGTLVVSGGNSVGLATAGTGGTTISFLVAPNVTSQFNVPFEAVINVAQTLYFCNSANNGIDSVAINAWIDSVNAN